MTSLPPSHPNHPRNAGPVRERLLAHIHALTRRMMSIENSSITEVCPIGIIDFEKWEWPQGVGLYALWKISHLTGDADLLACINAWYDRRLAEGLPGRNVNTTAPLLALAHLLESRPDPARLAICSEWAEWILRDMPRTEEGGLQHIVSGEENRGQLWDDTLYMTVLFLAKMGVLLKRPDYIEEAIHQFLVHIKYLHDPATGLWFHGWTFEGRHHFARALWARGNCWITAGTFDFLEMVPVPDGVRRHLVETVATQVRALERLQNADGMWHTLLDDSESYTETSATAGFAYGILKGVRLGHLDPALESTGRRALDAVLARVGDDGSVANVSYGTGMGHDLAHYRAIPICQMAYGQALALLLCTEALHRTPSP
jgi:unsaturated rhamnogalacturonyl hydrolase